MESWPQKPEFRDNSKTFNDVIWSDGHINMINNFDSILKMFPYLDPI